MADFKSPKSVILGLKLMSVHQKEVPERPKLTDFLQPVRHDDGWLGGRIAGGHDGLSHEGHNYKDMMEGKSDLA